MLRAWNEIWPLPVNVSKCENCDGRGFLVIRSMESAGTAINMKLNHRTCPICGGLGERLWTAWIW